MIKNGIIYSANAGDSRSIAFTTAKSTVSLSHDHKPENKIEKERIQNAGGLIVENILCKVLQSNSKSEISCIAVSRALGDFI